MPSEIKKRAENRSTFQLQVPGVYPGAGMSGLGSRARVGAEPSEAWALFHLDSPGDAKDDNAAKDWACKFNNRLSMRRPDYVVDVSGPTASFDAKLIWQPWPEGILGNTADAHDIFAVARGLWCPVKGTNMELRACTSYHNERLHAFVKELNDYASNTVNAIAATLRGHEPEGGHASVALVAASSALIAGEWQAAIGAATDCFAAHSRQLNAGNWPHKTWQQAHMLALGFYIAATLNILSNSLDSANTTKIDTCFQMSDTEFSSIKRAARQPVCTWGDSDSRVVRLGRTALEALNMATLMTEEKEIPSWFGVCILLAEEACVSEMLPRRILDQHSRTYLESNKLPREAIVGACSSNLYQGFVVPNTLPPGSPQIAPARTITRVSDPRLSIADFYSRFVNTNSPVIITGHMTRAKGWSPSQFWRDLSMFLKDNGTKCRLVPVELGRFQALQATGVISLGDLVENFLFSSNLYQHAASVVLQTKSNLLGAEDVIPGGRSGMYIAYMSQHPMFHQIPAFQHMFCIPPFTLGRIQPDIGAVNAWIGTKDTTTALHRDPYQNILAQTAGFKYIRLYSTSQTKMLYAEPALRGTNENTFMRSPVCVENPNPAEFPQFSSASFSETIIGPGDMLFIPYGMWHYVRSLTTSFSINFWWK